MQRPLRSFIVTAMLASVVTTSDVDAQIDTSEALPGATVGSDFYNNTYFAVGLNASLLSGAGLSGRVSFPKGFSAQLSSFVISTGGVLFFNVGAEGQYAFTQGDVGRLYGLVGFGYYLSDREDTNKPGNRIASPLRLGAGVGYEWFTTRNISLNVALGFTWFVEEAKVWPLPEVGLHYYFR